MVNQVVMQSEFYTSQFFSDSSPGSMSSARIVLGLLFEVYRPKSILDVGCGQGGWLAAAEELGVSKLVGVDGPWVDSSDMLSKNISFSVVDLELPLTLPEKFDLCVSLEVAEHLSSERAAGFVQDLCTKGDVIVFSAAIPSQGGVNHINEQWQSYWAGLFATEGYVGHDFFRPRLWNDERVESWYRQNTLLYVKSSHGLNDTLKDQVKPGPLDLVHPKLYHGNLETFRRPVEKPTLRFCWECICRWASRQLKRLLAPRGN
jgi:SAM-dependent methyltransferase